MKAIVVQDLIWGVGDDKDDAITDVWVTNDRGTARSVLSDDYQVVEITAERARAVKEDFDVDWCP